MVSQNPTVVHSLYIRICKIAPLPAFLYSRGLRTGNCTKDIANTQDISALDPMRTDITHVYYMFLFRIKPVLVTD